MLVVELPFVSQRISAMGTIHAPHEDRTTAEIAEAMARHGIAKATFVGHSLGTIYLAWMTRKRPELLASCVFIDPIVFLLHHHKVAQSFLYSRPQKRDALAAVERYFIKSERSIISYFHRHFYWFSNILWKHEVRVPFAVVLSTEDRIVPIEAVTRYLLGEEEKGFRSGFRSVGGDPAKGVATTTAVEASPSSGSFGFAPLGVGGERQGEEGGETMDGGARAEDGTEGEPEGEPPAATELLSTAVCRSNNANFLRRVLTLEGQSHGSFLVDRPSRERVLETIRDAQEWGASTSAEQQPARRRLAWSVLRNLKRQDRSQGQGRGAEPSPVPVVASVGADAREGSGEGSELQEPLRSRRQALARRLSRLWMAPSEGRVRQPQRRVVVPSMAQVMDAKATEVEVEVEDK
jgi:hypothetical protein